MSSATELAELHELIGSLRRCVTSFGVPDPETAPLRSM